MFEPHHDRFLIELIYPYLFFYTFKNIKFLLHISRPNFDI